MTTVVQTERDSYCGALLDLAKEFEDGFAYERDLYLSAFPGGDLRFMTRATHRAELFTQLARMMRERAENRSNQRTGDEPV